MPSHKRIERRDILPMAEYGLLLAGIAVVVMVAVIALGGAITGVFNDVVASF